MPNFYKFLTNHRIREKAEFDQVFKTRKKLSSKLGVLRYALNDLDHPRLGLIIAKKNVRFAVKRNLIRRILKEHFRLQQQALSGYDLVFVAHKEANSATRGELHQCFDTLLNQLISRSGAV